MKILVTGGAGFIGSAVVRLAIERGYEVVNVDCLTYAANVENLSSVSDNPKYHFEKINICAQTDIAQTLEKHRPQALMHLAAESHVDRSIDGPDAFMQTNVMGTFSLLQAWRTYCETLPAEDKSKYRFHHVSTDEVYGDLGPNDAPFSEATPYDPSSPYSASKAASDHLVRSWARTYDLPILITNCSNNYGPFQFPEKFIPVIILKILRGEKIPVYGKGDNIRDWLYVEDHADALLAVLENGTVGETYNIGGNNELTNLDVVKLICTILANRMDKPVGELLGLIEYVSDRPGHDRRYAINAEKIHRQLGWEPSVTGEVGFARTVDWYLDNKDWWQPLRQKGLVGKRLGTGNSRGQST